MSKSMVLWHATVTLVIASLLLWWGRQLVAQSSDQQYPSRPIHVVVPYAAGGGSDTFVRILAMGIVADDLLPQPIVIINQDGGIGTIGSREVKNASPDGYKILCHHNAIITAKLVETVSYGPEAFEPIAMTGEMSMVILVRQDAPFQSVADLLDQAKAAPNTVRFGANKGAPAYFATLQLEKSSPGAEFSIVSSGGGADRYSKILGGHLEAGIFSLSEYLDFRSAPDTPPDQNIRAIAVLSSQRHPSIPEVPTAAEAGAAVYLSNANYWWAPKGTPASIVDYLADVLEQAMQSSTVRAELQRIRMDPNFDRGASLSQRLEETVKQFESVASDNQASLPNFPIYVGGIVTLLLLWVLVESRRGERPTSSDLSPPLVEFVPHPRVAALSFLVLCGYVALLGRPWLPFAPLTACMVMAVGGVMIVGSRGNGGRARWIVLLQLSLLTAFGAEFVFRELLVTPLP